MGGEDKLSAAFVNKNGRADLLFTFSFEIKRQLKYLTHCRRAKLLDTLSLAVAFSLFSKTAHGYR